MTFINNSTSAFYERSNLDLTTLRARAESLQQGLSSGQKLARSSDDPVAASRLRTLARADSLSNIDLANANRATADLTLTDTALSNFASYITRAKELATQAANGTLTDTQRLGIGEELKQIHGELVSLANTRDSSGHMLFGGESTDKAYTLDAGGNAIYVGTAEVGELPLGDGQKVSRGLTGPEFLNFSVNGAPTDLMAVVKSLGEALQGGSTDSAGDARAALTSLDSALGAVTTSQTIVGARLSWIDLTTDRRTNLSELRATEQADIGGTDIPSTIAQLQQIMLVLDASQASFGKLAGLSLFDQIR